LYKRVLLQELLLYSEIYDKYGEDGFSGGGGSMSPEEVFASLFGFGGTGYSRQKRGKDIIKPFSVTLEDLYNGKTTKISLQRDVVCSLCHGKGSKSGATKKCHSCEGRGVRVAMRQIGPGMIQRINTVCANCDGTGGVIREKDKCKKCKGLKVVEEKKKLDIYIEKGMQNNQKIVMQGEADQEFPSSISENGYGQMQLMTSGGSATPTLDGLLTSCVFTDEVEATEEAAGATSIGDTFPRRILSFVAPVVVEAGLSS
ncbi:1373_t:CDS:2, partial [Dentiscutata heterogama]